MSIREKIENVQGTIVAERAATGGNSPTALRLQKKATAAILGGEAEIRAYMEEFSKAPEDLAKLMPPAGEAVDSAKNIARAYLMGNGPCGSASPQGPGLGLLFGVSGILDEA